jgi:hypothetical protein
MGKSGYAALWAALKSGDCAAAALAENLGNRHCGLGPQSLAIGMH